MRRFVPLATFEHEHQAVIAVDTDGSVQFSNRTARSFLGRALDGAAARCWDRRLFSTLEGDDFCGPRCPVQEAARQGRIGAKHWVLPTKGIGAGRPVEMISYFVPWGPSRRYAVLHFLRPATTQAAATTTPPAVAIEANGLLSRREAEVLGHVYEGRSTSTIAETLGIATNTVRNHLASAFRKLGVHGRIEALVAMRLSGGPSVLSEES